MIRYFVFWAVGHGLPVVAALGAGADRNPFAGVLVRDDIGPVGEQPFLAIEPGEYVLEDGLLGVEELARLSVELPEDARLCRW